MARQLFDFMYDTILVNIVIHSESINIYTEILHKKKIKNAIEKSFVLNDSYNDELLQEYLHSFCEDTPYFYLAMLDASSDQGAVPTCDRHKMSLYKDLSTSKYLCIDDQWGCYTSALSLEEEIKRMGDIGVDFIFSPFVLLKNFFSDKVVQKEAMYVLIQDLSLTIAVFKEGKLLFGEYVDLHLEVPMQEDTVLLDISAKEADARLDDEMPIEEEESVDLDEIELDNELTLDDELDDIDSLDNIEELGNLDDLSESSDLEQQLEENLEAISTKENLEEFENGINTTEQSSEDFRRFSLIQRALDHYYKDNRYESDFIEEIYVADGVHVSNDFKRLIQDEMFLTLYVRNIEIELEVCQLAKEELKLL